MHSITTLVTLLGLGLVSVQAAPQAPLIPRAIGFARQCSDLKLHEGWLIGNCYGGENNRTKIKSTVFLGKHIGNNESILQWSIDGFFQESCPSCNLINEGSVLNCTCHNSWRGESVSTVNLEEHISNYNGHLLSNLAGTPSIPTNSKYPIPESFEYGVAVSHDTSCTGQSTYYNKVPIKCNVSWNWSPIPLDLFSGRFTSANPGWEMVLFNNTECTGEPIDRILPESGTTCKIFRSKTIGYSIRPLWNSN